MTSESVQALADEMMQFDYISNYAARDNTTLPIYNGKSEGEPNPHLWLCKQGFDKRYEVPLSKGGVYPSASDFNALFHLASHEGKRMLSGCRSIWRKDAVSHIGGYPAGVVLRSTDNHFYLSRKDDNVVSPPDNQSDTENWRHYRNQKMLVGYPYDPYYVFDGGCVIYPCGYGIGDITKPEGLFYHIPTRTPRSDRKLWMKVCIPIDAVYGFTGLAKCIAKYQTASGEVTFWTNVDLCSEGECVIRLSRFDDIYENEDHLDSSVIVYAKRNWMIGTKKMDYGSSSLIPLKAGIYYLYIEYTNGCASYDTMTYYGLLDYSIRLIAECRRLKMGGTPL